MIRLELYNEANTERIAFIPLNGGELLELFEEEDLNGDHKLMGKMDATGAIWPEMTERRWLRLTDPDAGTAKHFFIYGEKSDERTIDNSLEARFEAFRTKKLLKKHLIESYHTFSKIMPSVILDAILDGSGFTAGDCDFSDLIDFTIDWDYAEDKLLELKDAVNGFLVIGDDKIVHLKSSIGAEQGMTISYRKQLKSVTRRVDYWTIVNRIYPLGATLDGKRLDINGYSGYSGYVEDAASVAKWGVCPGRLYEDAVPGVINLCATPALDGTYAGGVCENWSATGGAVLSENTDSAYCKIDFAVKSQKVQGSADNDGARQNITLTAGKPYSAFVWVYIVSGTVKFQIDLGGGSYSDKGYSSATGWVKMTLENFEAAGTGGGIRIAQDGAGTSEFYLQAVQFVQDILLRNEEGLVKGDARESLALLAQSELAKTKDPAVEYTVDAVDLFGHDYAVWPYEEFNAGDLITVNDPELSLNEKLRVYFKRTNLLELSEVTVRIGKDVPNVKAFIKAVSKVLGIDYKRAG